MDSSVPRRARRLWLDRWRRLCGLPSCQQFAVSTCWRHALAFIRFVWLLYWFVFWNFNMVAFLFHRLEEVLDSYDSSAKDDSGLPSCEQFAVSTWWRHALAFIRLLWLLYWFVFWNFNMVAFLFHRLENVLDSYDSNTKDDSGLPSYQQFAVSTCWRHALAFIWFVWLLYWFVFWNYNMVALLFHRLEDVLDKTR